jgi:hypothetical protein
MWKRKGLQIITFIYSIMMVPKQSASVLRHAHLTTTPTISIPEVQDKEYQSSVREEVWVDSVPLAETWNSCHPP